MTTATATRTAPKAVGSNRDAGKAKPPVISADTGLKMINNRIRKLGVQMKATDDEIQSIIVNILEHAAGIGKGDISAAGRLCQTLDMSKTYRVSVVAKYINENTSINVSKKGATWTANLKKEDSDNFKSLEDSIAFTKLEAEDSYAFFDSIEADRGDPGLFMAVNVDDTIKGLIARIKRNIEPNKQGEVKADKKDIPLLRAQMQSLELLHDKFASKKLEPIQDDNTIGEKKAA